MPLGLGLLRCFDKLLITARGVLPLSYRSEARASQGTALTANGA